MKCHIYTLKAKRFVPPGFVEQSHDELDLVFYLSADKHQAPSAICYEGRRLKHSFHYRYLTHERRTEALEQYVNKLQKRFNEKLELQKKRKAFKTSLLVGDFLSTSWGYDQTNVEFFQVTGVKSAKRISLREVSKTLITDNTACDYGKVTANQDDFIDEEIIKTVSLGEYVRFESFRSASKWDGQPKYCSWYA